MTVDHLTHLEGDAAAFVELLRATDLSAPVPVCSPWALRDLATHLGTVHRWITAIVRSGEKQPPAAYAPDDTELADWSAAGAADLIAALREAGPDRACWTFSGAGQTAYWSRRMALETAVHRLDAQRCAGVEATIDEELAQDGIAEVLDVMLPRQVALERIVAPTSGATLVTGTTRLLGAEPPTATVTGAPSAVLLLLWRRLSRTDPRLVVTGDLDSLDQLLAVALTP